MALVDLPDTGATNLPSVKPAVSAKRHQVKGEKIKSMGTAGAARGRGKHACSFTGEGLQGFALSSNARAPPASHSASESAHG